MTGGQVEPRVVARVLDPMPLDERHRELTDWAQANGLAPSEVRVGAGCPVEILSNDTIRWRQNVLNDAGVPQLACGHRAGAWEGHTGHQPCDGDCKLLTREVVSPLLVPLPAHLADPA